ncbi:hypothetical protein [Microbacterium nanhaiense]|uniref:hypothetical protein n=1 Tax=Microbacterium nanhaiense TaxID=1301026 RepID=UPI0016639AD8|nr:hypothetical protein [Microbacterium nanhaiense]
MSYPAPPQPIRPVVAPRPGIGIVAFIASAAAVVLGGVGIWVAGFMLGRLVRLTEIPELALGLQEEGWVLLEGQFWEVIERAVGAFVVLVVAWIVHMALAAWGLVQGIVATAMGRGRAWGIAAIVLALFGWLALAWFTQDALLAGLVGNVPFMG